MTRAAVEEFVQQHGGPHRHPVLASLDQPRRGRRADDARHAVAVTQGSITLPADHASVGLDLDLQYLRVFGTGKLAQRQAAARTLGRVELDELNALGQLRLHRASMTRRAVPMPSPCAHHRRLGLCLTTAAGLALAAKQALLEIAHLRLRHFQFRAQHRLALRALVLQLAQFLVMALRAPCGTRHDSPAQGPPALGCGLHHQLGTLRSLLLQLEQFVLMSPLVPLSTFARPAVQALPAVGPHHQPDVLLLGQRDVYAGERHRRLVAHRGDRIDRAQHRIHAATR